MPALLDLIPRHHHDALWKLMDDIHLLYEVGRDREAASRVHSRILSRVYHTNGDGR